MQIHRIPQLQYAQFAGHHLLVTKAPTLSNLTYRVYDIQRKACIKEIIIPNKVAQDAKFIISPDHKYVYDVIDVVPLKKHTVMQDKY